jgi:hypothetical protein
MLEAHPDLTRETILGLGWLYLLLFLMNAGWAWRSFKRHEHTQVRLGGLLGEGQDVPTAGFWAMYAALPSMISLAHFTGASSPDTFVLRMPEWSKVATDTVVADPVYYFVFSIVLFGLIIWLRDWWTKPDVAWILLNASLVFMALAMTDWDFRQIVGKPDNVPIVAMLFIVAFFTWIYFRRAGDNDRRIEQGLPLREKADGGDEKILVWPDLVYTELICMIVLTVILVAWGIVLQAPLEEPASAVKTPNPSKAPWYFLGLQEMLVYYDPWLAGVVFPSVILVGLMAIPYIDFNKKGNGYYTFKERWFAVSVFLFGFLPLWVAMIVLGTFLRGPNWNIFGLFEFWDVHKLEVLNNVNLSEIVWLEMLGQALPKNPLIREAPGFIAVFIYLFALPPLLAIVVFRKMFQRLGFIRYMVFINLLLLMAALPIKMVLRWSLNLKYIVAIPEYFFNI